MDKLQKFFALVKVDEATRMVYGLVTAQVEDKDNEICDYATTKPEYEKVNAELGKASAGENIMPLREMHQLNAVGAGKSIDFDDARKQIRMAFKVVDDQAWKKVTEKVLLGFSQGGRYLKRWKQDGKDFYTAQPGEVSLVDNPCLPGAFIEYAKADGTVELFKTKGPSELSAEDLQKLIDGVSASLGTQLSKLHSPKSEVVEDIATGATMKPEDIKKCAAALGISEEEFKKNYVAADELTKAKKGLAALHGHMETAMEHHEAMHKAHAAMGSMHEKMSTHLGKCMKACKDVMGSDEKESEKALKALLADLAPATKVDDKSGFTKADAAKMVEDALAKQAKEFQDKLDKLPAPAATPGLFRVPRDASEGVKKAENSQEPLPV